MHDKFKPFADGHPTVHLPAISTLRGKPATCTKRTLCGLDGAHDTGIVDAFLQPEDDRAPWLCERCLRALELHPQVIPQLKDAQKWDRRRARPRVARQHQLPFQRKI